MTTPPTSVTHPSVWVLTNAPSPYQVELLSALADLPQLDIDVRFLRDTSHAGPLRRFPHRICRPWLVLSRGDELRWHPHPIREAAFGRFDVFVLSGLYTSVTFLMCAALLKLRGKPWMIWWERPHARQRKTSGFAPIRWLHSLKDSIRRWLLSSARIVMGIGSVAVFEYEAMGVPPERLRMLPYCCDVTRFSNVPAETRDKIRSDLGWSDHLVFLFSGQMIPRKGVDVLLKSFITVAERHPHVALLLLGEGSDRTALEKLVPTALSNRIRFEGHIRQRDLPERFAAADVFTFSSRHDGWAVVLNEACAAGLPIIATHQTGAAHDLVQEGANGFRIEADDVPAMTQALEWFVNHQDQIPAMGARSQELIKQFSVDQGASTFVRHVHDCLKS